MQRVDPRVQVWSRARPEELVWAGNGTLARGLQRKGGGRERTQMCTHTTVAMWRTEHSFTALRF